MKVMVDQAVCIGCGLCTTICPEVFEMDGDKAKVIVDEVPAALNDGVQEATNNCPVSCIVIKK